MPPTAGFQTYSEVVGARAEKEPARCLRKLSSTGLQRPATASWPTTRARSSPPWISWSTLYSARSLIPHDLELKKEALRLGRDLLRGTKYEEG
jgi:hypothetical protein